MRYNLEIVSKNLIMKTLIFLINLIFVAEIKNCCEGKLILRKSSNSLFSVLFGGTKNYEFCGKSLST